MASNYPLPVGNTALLISTILDPCTVFGTLSRNPVDRAVFSLQHLNTGEQASPRLTHTSVRRSGAIPGVNSTARAQTTWDVRIGTFSQPTSTRTSAFSPLPVFCARIYVVYTEYITAVGPSRFKPNTAVLAAVCCCACWVRTYRRRLLSA